MTKLGQALEAHRQLLLDSQDWQALKKNTKKPKIPLQVANAIEQYKIQATDRGSITNCLARFIESEIFNPSDQSILDNESSYRYVVEKGYLEELIDAFIFGYEIEKEKPKFRIGEYYSSNDEGGIIYKIVRLSCDSIGVQVYKKQSSAFYENSIYEYDECDGDRKATENEIALFNRAEMYHKHGRKLDDLRVGDLVQYFKVPTSLKIVRKNEIEFYVNHIIEYSSALYLTAETIEKARKERINE